MSNSVHLWHLRNLGCHLIFTQFLTFQYLSIIASGKHLVRMNTLFSPRLIYIRGTWANNEIKIVQCSLHPGRPDPNPARCFPMDHRTFSFTLATEKGAECASPKELLWHRVCRWCLNCLNMVWLWCWKVRASRDIDRLEKLDPGGATTTLKLADVSFCVRVD